jgi:transcriptional antiterminator RfaH
VSASRVDLQRGGFRWYLVLARRGRERLAKDGLERKGFDVYLPMHAPAGSRLLSGRAPTPRPFLPGYLFVSVDVAAPGWREIFSAFGVQDVYCTGRGVERRPLAVPPGWIEQLQNREVNGLVTLPGSDPLKCDIRPGATVRFKGLRSCDLEAVFLEPVDAKRGAILISLLGADSRAIVPLNQLQQSSD